jgi:hypothetical protein
VNATIAMGCLVRANEVSSPLTDWKGIFGTAEPTLSPVGSSITPALGTEVEAHPAKASNEIAIIDIIFVVSMVNLLSGSKGNTF